MRALPETPETATGPVAAVTTAAKVTAAVGFVLVICSISPHGNRVAHPDGTSGQRTPTDDGREGPHHLCIFIRGVA